VTLHLPHGSWFGLDTVDEKPRDCRPRKMVTKYVGLVQFGMPTSADPHSVLYARVTGHWMASATRFCSGVMVSAVNVGNRPSLIVRPRRVGGP
jgi:hypothetical protein